jgi:hypothetical protein
MEWNYKSIIRETTKTIKHMELESNTLLNDCLVTTEMTREEFFKLLESNDSETTT